MKDSQDLRGGPNFDTIFSRVGSKLDFALNRRRVELVASSGEIKYSSTRECLAVSIEPWFLGSETHSEGMKGEKLAQKSVPFQTLFREKSAKKGSFWPDIRTNERTDERTENGWPPAAPVPRREFSARGEALWPPHSNILPWG